MTEAAWIQTRRLEVLESFVNAPLEFGPFRKVVLGAGSHQLRFGCPCRRFEVVLAGDQLGVEETKIEGRELQRTISHAEKKREIHRRIPGEPSCQSTRWPERRGRGGIS